MRYVEIESEESAPAFVLSDIETSQYDINRARKLAKQGTFMNLADGTSLLVKRSTKPPPQRPARVSGKFEHLLGDETTRVFVAFLLRPWVLDSVHKEGFHLGENVTLASIERHCRRIGVIECEMVDSSLSCASSRENVTPSATIAVDFTPASIFAWGDVSFDILGPLPKTKNENK